MKKILIPIMATALAGVVSAQSSVTLGGRIDVSVASQKTKVGGVGTTDPVAGASTRQQNVGLGLVHNF